MARDPASHRSQERNTYAHASTDNVPYSLIPFIQTTIEFELYEDQVKIRFSEMVLIRAKIDLYC